ncbi:N-acetylmuramoyl-L-alanine amidase [Candidatus Dependentiae bacterium]|nr:N-acetylmuramoyl-L-alanine amidase [Candidatus Dependentiae bacterium]
MNILHKKSIFLAIKLITILSYATCNTSAQSAQSAGNKLNWMEVSQGKFATQIMFDFSQPIFFNKKLNKEKFRLKLTFPGMGLEQFKQSEVVGQLNKLKKQGLVSNVWLHEKDAQITSVVLAIDFAQTVQSHGKNRHNKGVTPEKNRLLIKWATLESPNRLIIDIFTKQTLDELEKHDNMMLQARNNVIMSDTTQEIYLPNKSKQQKNLRIVIDPGHGGSQPGARAFGLQEKDLALDIAQRVKKQLNQAGFNTVLTRNVDKTMSLLERSELAVQLKADLFVSIHVNATGKKDPHENGVETFYLNNKYVSQPANKSGFILMNLKNQERLPEIVNNTLQKNAHASRSLATEIQNNLVNALHKHKHAVTNRGIKTDGFRVLLRSAVPAALVEVGFLTNKKEAAHLAQEQYRSVIAQGIYQGIEKFVQINH